MQSVLMLWELVVFAFLPTFGEPVTENGKEPAPARPDFEAAFQGECATASICEQKCANLHDGTFECDCHLGYALHTNGYSCHRVNVTRQTEGPVGQKMRRSDRNPSLQRAGGSLLDTHGFVIHDLYGLSVSRAGLVERLVVRDRDPSRLSTRNPLEGNYCTGDPDCSGSGKCVRDPDADLERCVCDLGYIGHRCEQSVTISEPKFSGKSWLQFPVLREAYETLNIVLEFLPYEPDAVLFLSGEKEDFAGDFFSISLVGGVVEIRMDCGSGFGVVKSTGSVVLRAWNRLEVRRFRWDISVVLNGGPVAKGRSQGMFSRITFCSPVLIGGIGNATSVVEGVLRTRRGFAGCMRLVQINGRVFDFRTEAERGQDVDDCASAACRSLGCVNGGKCGKGNMELTCLCPFGFHGKHCQDQIDVQVPSFGGSSFLELDGLGAAAALHFELSMSIKPEKADGIVAYNAGHVLRGFDLEDPNYFLVYLLDQRVVFEFNLGFETIAVKSPTKVALWRWHKITITRTGRLGYLKVDDEPPVTGASRSGFTQLLLNRNLFLGGAPRSELPSGALTRLPSQDANFHGCIDQISLNGEALDVTGPSVQGVNVANCRDCAPGKCQHRSLPLLSSDAGILFPGCSSSTPAFAISGNGYLYMPTVDPTPWNETETSFIRLRVKTVRLDGLLLWAANSLSYDDESDPRDRDLIAVFAHQGRTHIRYIVDNGLVHVLEDQTTFLADGQWHCISITRKRDGLSLSVDGNPETTSTHVPESFWQRLNSLFIGGIPGDSPLESSSAQELFKAPAPESHGFFGCVQPIVSASGEILDVLGAAVDRRNLASCDGR